MDTLTAPNMERDNHTTVLEELDKQVDRMDIKERCLARCILRLAARLDKLEHVVSNQIAREIEA